MSELYWILQSIAQRNAGRLFGYANIQRYLQRQKPNRARKARNSIATGNRHGGPHRHEREIARRLRQST